jgi:hypothetical protein
MKAISAALAAAIILGASAAVAGTPSWALPAGASGMVEMNGLTMFDSTMSPEALDRFYRDVLPKHGYKPAFDVRRNGTLSFYFYGGKGGSVVFTAKNGKTGVMLTFLK